MGYIDDVAEEVLAFAIESTDHYATEITFTPPSDSSLSSFTLNGIINHTYTQDRSTGTDIVGVYRSIEIRYSSLIAKAGYPDDSEWEDNIPSFGWLISYTDGKNSKTYELLIEPGSICRADQFGWWKVVLADVEEVS